MHATRLHRARHPHRRSAARCVRCGGCLGIPYEIAKQRKHPHQDAIGAATWVSLFTLGALWPFLWIWAMAYRPDRGWGLSGPANSDATSAQLEKRITALEQQLGHPG
ncbi:DUF3302 domain-containing protein [Bradyrhizobium sp. TZ2]